MTDVCKNEIINLSEEFNIKLHEKFKKKCDSFVASDSSHCRFLLERIDYIRKACENYFELGHFELGHSFKSFEYEELKIFIYNCRFENNLTASNPINLSYRRFCFYFILIEDNRQCVILDLKEINSPHSNMFPLSDSTHVLSKSRRS